jgi:hypothetical protein
MHKSRTDLFGRAPAHVQRELHDLRLNLKKEEEERQAKARRARILQAAQTLETWEEIAQMTVPLRRN